MIARLEYNSAIFCSDAIVREIISYVIISPIALFQIEHSLIYSFTQFNYHLNKRDVIIRYVISGRWISDRDAAQYYAITVAGKDAGMLS